MGHDLDANMRRPEIAIVLQLLLDLEFELSGREPICRDRSEQRHHERAGRIERRLARKALMPIHRHPQPIPRPELVALPPAPVPSDRDHTMAGRAQRSMHGGTAADRPLPEAARSVPCRDPQIVRRREVLVETALRAIGRRLAGAIARRSRIRWSQPPEPAAAPSPSAFRRRVRRRRHTPDRRPWPSRLPR